MGISIEPHELAQMVKGANAIWQARGGEKDILHEEKPVIDFAYASVVTIAPIKAGQVFDKSNTWVKRPGTGPLLAKALPRVLGKKALRDLPAETQISPGDVDGF